MAFLSSIMPLLADVAVKKPTGAWVFFIELFRNPAFSYGWSVIIFTIVLKLVLLPLDFYQKKVAYDNKKKTEAMEPYMEKLRKQYGNDKMAMSAKQRELQKKFKFNTFGPCLPALLSLFIFITLFGGFRKIADYEIYKAYNDTRTAYVSSYTETAADNPGKFNAASALYESTIADTGAVKNINLNEAAFYARTSFIIVYGEGGVISEYKPGLSLNTNLADTVKNENDSASPDADKIYDALLVSLAQDAALKEYNTHKKDLKFLWIKNMWRPDAVWGMNGCNFAAIQPVFPDADLYKNSMTSGCAGCGGMTEYKKDTSVNAEYLTVMQKVINDNNKFEKAPDKKGNVKYGNYYNGYYVLAVLIVGLSILSTKFNAAGNPAAAPQQAAGAGEPGQPGAGMNMKMMMYMMPIMMGFFAVSSNSAFSLYMVASTGTSLLSTLLCGFLIKLYDKKKTAKAEENKFKRYVKK